MKQKLIDSLAKVIMRLPGNGPRSARRAAFFLLNNKEAILLPMIEVMQSAYNQVKTCEVCGNFDDISPCGMCLSESKENVLCIVKDHADLFVIQSSKAYNGKYHVLGKNFAPSASNAQDIIKQIRQRIERENFEEIVLALHPSVDGRILLHYISISLEDLGKKLTHLGLGIPIGADFDYVDNETMAAAIIGRQPIS